MDTLFIFRRDALLVFVLLLQVILNCTYQGCVNESEWDKKRIGSQDDGSVGKLSPLSGHHDFFECIRPKTYALTSPSEVIISKYESMR